MPCAPPRRACSRRRTSSSGSAPPSPPGSPSSSPPWRRRRPCWRSRTPPGSPCCPPAPMVRSRPATTRTPATRRPRRPPRRPPLARPRERRRRRRMRSPPRSASSTRPAPPPTPPTPQAFAAETADLTRSLDAELAPLRGRPFLVFHDAYRYFEHRFGIPAAGSVALTEGVPPGTARVARPARPRAARGDRLRLHRAAVRAEAPRHDHRGQRRSHRHPRPPRRLPASGPQLYPALLRGLADNLAACLAE